MEEENVAFEDSVQVGKLIWKAHASKWMLEYHIAHPNHNQITYTFS